MSYADLLRDPRWQKKRLEVMQSAAFACELCGDKQTTLNVHHVRYVHGRKPWDYDRHELQCLCERCHSLQHPEKASALPGAARIQAGADALRANVDQLARADRRAKALANLSDVERSMCERLAAIDARLPVAESSDEKDTLVQEKMELLSQIRSMDHARQRIVRAARANG